MKVPPRSAKSAVDPVCGMGVDSNPAAITSEFDGGTYYFCAEGCRRRFEADPCRYLAPKRKGFWGRYVDRLQKSTGGKAMKCH